MKDGGSDTVYESVCPPDLYKQEWSDDTTLRCILIGLGSVNHPGSKGTQESIGSTPKHL